MAETQSNGGDFLTSWKEIAAYLGKGVRTVQRWEHELSLPVRRPVPNNPRLVIAVRAGLDVWVRRQMPRGRRVHASDVHAKQANAQLTRLLENIHRADLASRRLRQTAQGRPTGTAAVRTQSRQLRDSARRTRRKSEQLHRASESLLEEFVERKQVSPPANPHLNGRISLDPWLAISTSANV